MTKVVHYKKDSFDVWVGRDSYNGLLGFGNPFIIGMHGNRTQVISLYRNYLLTNTRLLSKIESLRDKTLACACKPLPCHADVIVELLNMVNVYSKIIPKNRMINLDVNVIVRDLVAEHRIDEKRIVNIQANSDNDWHTVVLFEKRNNECLNS